ncbi:conserved hypothetical protein [Acidovorax delafieldii 2AN]|uniref:Lipoprotein n=1 Tax=Acidovorax delafieldii 2AN TaxID=573060 RepID=C5T391_ACIDE|nr:hypothetical protein [Acidovorax delafieldii]EER61055.1 conserved hypothetical protein [Acidovorax delafieldii 2AN]
MQPDRHPRLARILLMRLPPADRIAGLAAALLLTGCAAPPAPAPVVPVPPEAQAPTDPEAPTSAQCPPTAPEDGQPIQQLLAQTDRLLRLAPPELAREIARLSEAEDASDEAPLLLAIALAQSRQPVDTARALGLVQRTLGNNAPAAQPLHSLARLMEARLLQQRRLEEQQERQAQQLRDAQRRSDQLNERIEAVRTIERSLATRPLPSPPAAPASSNGNSTHPPP